MSAAVKHQPATPLPFALREVNGEPENTLTIHVAGKPLSVVLWRHAAFRDRGRTRQNLAYLVHAANAYPKLVQDAKERIEFLGRLAVVFREGTPTYEACIEEADRTRALLRDLGEQE